ncbi:MAG: glycyl radical protein [Candidatus Krumholzibacteriota bacterium]|nr:glycyl radical protein [Candidatus Krumholzibacteriota bacterium]
MNERIERLRKQSLEALPEISMERALLVTEYSRENKEDRSSVPVSRAKTLKYILGRKALCVNPGELIVGERGPFPKATPTYPEICTHSLEDLDILDKREKVSFKVSDEARRIQAEEIIPFWTGKSIRERLFGEVSEEWLKAYKAGVFTEFQEQRAPGHTVLDDKIYKKGLLSFKQDIKRSVDAVLEEDLPGRKAKLEELKAMDIAADALIAFAQRYSEKLFEMAEDEKDKIRKDELLKMSVICNKIPANAPETLWEALQYYWFVHIGIITELNTWDSFNPGRLDQHLLPFYRKGLADGSLTEESARELLQSFWIKFNNQPAPPKVGVTAEESNTYTDFCLINLGGVDPAGQDGVNEMTFLILDVIEEMRLLQPGTMVQVSRENPDAFLDRALRIIKTGFGQPSIFNAEAIVNEMLRQGKTISDARNGGASGCVETGAFGKESYILTGYFNLPKVLEVTLHNGVDPLTGVLIGIETGDPRQYSSFEEFYEAFEKQLGYFVDIKIKGNFLIESLWARILPAPFMSLLIDDCIQNGADYNAGGARYNSSYIQGVGLGTITDAVTAIKYHIFDNRKLTFDDLIVALDNDFKNDEELRKMLVYETPKYGNDEDYPDELMNRIFESFFGLVDGIENSKGGHFRIDMLPTTCHVYFGRMTGALPDGRKARRPLSEGISPVQGADRKGPTAVLKSAARFDHIKTGGTLLNQKFTPQVFSTREGIEKIRKLVRAYFSMNGHHIQFNVVKADTLRKAQKEPENYRDLIVRVAGYSDYFVDLGTDLQDEIIERTEHEVDGSCQ